MRISLILCFLCMIKWNKSERLREINNASDKPSTGRKLFHNNLRNNSSDIEYTRATATSSFTTTNKTTSVTTDPAESGEDYNSKIAQEASLITAVAFIPGIAIAFLMCFYIPRWYDKYYYRPMKQKKTYAPMKV